MSDLATLRQQAQQFTELQQASTRLAELERQQQAEALHQQAEALAAHAQTEFSEALTDFQAAKVTLDLELTRWLEQGLEIIQRRQKLATRANGLSEMAQRLAYARLAAGLGDPVLSNFDRNTAVKAESEQILINRTGHARLMIVDDLDGPAGILLNTVTGLTGDLINRQRKPAKITLDTANGPVIEIH